MSTKAIDEAVTMLDDENGVTRACETVEAWAKAGSFQNLIDLATKLESQADPKTDNRKRRARLETVVDHIEDQVALVPKAEAIDALLALSLHERANTVEMPRTRSMRLCAFASRLGYGQSVEELLAAIDRAGERVEHQELFACWVQEVVLRGNGAALAKDPRAKRFQDSLAQSGHPLALMPLDLLQAEREAPSYMPLYGDKGLGRAIDTLASGTMSIRTIPPPADGAAVRATRVSDDAVTERMQAAVRPWGEGKSGKIEAKVFTLDPKIDAGSLGSWLLRALPLDSTSGVARLDCSRSPVEGIFGPLFSAASNGGAYSSGLGGAYGRLAAWTTLGALAGAAADASIADINTATSKCTFLTFRAPGPWFHDVAWDFGVVSLRPAGDTVAVLAATDTE